ncbi:hypothetical protein PSHT_01225 [Puccinia striiformis]|uniref:Secreted protein n=1 Tax=Puccinia striiformis TaxID=27350 RepID=A0A2S4WL35_9BASI|nr:hypothetical protein PSHT_01225 [Puccinia striiformis]
MNSFQGGYLSITLVALFVFLHSGQAIATTQTCDAYFGPSNDPRRNYCSSDGTRYSCGVNSCKAGDRPWSSVYFQNCYLIVNKVVTTKRKNEVYPIQYHNHWWTVDAQDIHDRKWYSCSYTRDVPDDLNAQRPS